jgi:hypothetical protein
MSTLPDLQATAIATSVRFEDERLHVAMADGREISVPVAWYPRLA